MKLKNKIYIFIGIIMLIGAINAQGQGTQRVGGGNNGIDSTFIQGDSVFIASGGQEYFSGMAASGADGNGNYTCLFQPTPTYSEMPKPATPETFDYYVDAVNGNDSNNGTTRVTAWKTLTKVTNALKSTPTTPVDILLMAGTYTDGIGWNYNPPAYMLRRIFTEGQVVIDQDSSLAPYENGILVGDGAGSATGFDYEVQVVGPITIRDISNNGIATYNDGLLRIWDATITDAFDGMSAHSGSKIYAYDCTVRDCGKYGLAHVSATTETYHYRCLIEGKTGATGVSVIEDGFGYFYDCDFLPDTTNSQSIEATGTARVLYEGCRIGSSEWAGTWNQAAKLNGSTFNYCYFNTSATQYDSTFIRNSFGVLSITPDGPTTDTLTIENSVFVSGYTGNDFLQTYTYSSPANTGGVINAKNNIFTGFDAVFATPAGSATTHADANWDVDYNLFYSNSSNYTNMAAGGNDVSGNPLLVGAGIDTTLIHFSTYENTSPAIGAGEAGSDIGIAKRLVLCDGYFLKNQTAELVLLPESSTTATETEIVTGKGLTGTGTTLDPAVLGTTSYTGTDGDFGEDRYIDVSGNSLFIGDAGGTVMEVDGADQVRIGGHTGTQMLNVRGKIQLEYSNSVASVLIGNNAGGAGGTGASGNVAIGNSAGAANTASTAGCTFVGPAAGLATTGNNNTYIGFLTGGNLTSGTGNTAVGYQSMLGASTFTASDNTAVGKASLLGITTGSNNVAVGTTAMDACTSCTQNVGIGINALGSITTATQNTAIGTGALSSNLVGSYNSAIGINALAASKGTENTAIGYYAGAYITTATNTTSLGTQAGQYANRNGNISIGDRANAIAADSTFSNVMVLGKLARPTANNQIVLGDANGSYTQLRSRNFVFNIDATPATGNILAWDGTEFSPANTSTGLDANYWKIGGQSFTVQPTIGPSGTRPMHFQTNGTRRFSIPSSGIADTPASTKALVLSSTDSLGYTTLQSGAWSNTVTQSGSDTLLNSATGYGHLTRVGNYVTFTLRIEIALTNSGNTNTFYIDPPVASNFVNTASDVVGVASMDTQSLSSANTAKQRCLLFASTADDKIGISIDPVSGLTYPENRMYVSVSGSYVIQ